MRVLRELWRRLRARPRQSLLRELVSEEAFARDPAAALLDAAVLLRRSGLEHLVTEATPAEVLALARAGEFLNRERTSAFLAAWADPARAFAEFDGGEELRRSVLAEALAAARRS